MKIPREDWFKYRKMHTLKEEYKAECGWDLFIVCFNMYRTKDFPNRLEFVTDTMILREKLPRISDDYLIDICNECLCYENLLALYVLLEEVTKRNAEREDGNKLLFYKERKNEDEYLYAE